MLDYTCIPQPWFDSGFDYTTLDDYHFGFANISHDAKAAFSDTRMTIIIIRVYYLLLMTIEVSKIT